MPKKSKEPKQPVEPVEIDFCVLQFYDALQSLLYDAGRYAHSVKLKENLDDPETAFKVEHVLQRYYDGDMRKLSNEIYSRRIQCYCSISSINKLCDRYGRHLVRDKEALTELLLSEPRRRAWSRIMKKYKNSNEIVSLQFIELEYRRNLQNRRNQQDKEKEKKPQ